MNGTATFYSAGNVGIGTSTPGALLDVAGTARVNGFIMPTGALANEVLMTDANGVGTWQADSLKLPYFASMSDPFSIVFGISTTSASTIDLGLFAIFNPSNAGRSVTAQSNGTGDTIGSFMTGTGRAGFFQINNSNNSNDALFVETNGGGSALLARTTGDGDAAVEAISNGTGPAGWFRNNSTSNPDDALVATTNGHGSALFAATFNGANQSPALSVHTAGGFAAELDGRVFVEGDIETTDFVQREYTPGTPHCAIPIAYGSISSAGVITGGTGNFTIASHTATGVYDITITGEVFDNEDFVVSITPISNSPRFATVADAGSSFRVNMWNIAGALVDTGFQFTIWTNNPN